MTIPPILQICKHDTCTKILEYYEHARLPVRNQGGKVGSYHCLNFVDFFFRIFMPFELNLQQSFCQSEMNILLLIRKVKNR